MFDLARIAQVRATVILAVIVFAAFSCSSSDAAQTSGWQVTLTRGSANTFVGVHTGITREAAESSCAAAVPTNNSTAITYTCGAARRVFVVTPNPVTCPAAPAPRTGLACPTGTVGTWSQTATVGPPPACAITWNPPTAPATLCVVETAPGRVTLQWTAPTHNERICMRAPDGSEVNCVGGDPLTNLAGFRLTYGTQGGSRPAVVQFPAATLRHTITLSEGDWFFAVKAFNSEGVESAPSNVISVRVDL